MWFLMCFTVKVQLWKPFRIPLGGPVIWSLPWVRVPPSWFSRSFGARLLWKTVPVSAALGQEWELPRTQSGCLAAAVFRCVLYSFNLSLEKLIYSLSTKSKRYKRVCNKNPVLWNDYVHASTQHIFLTESKKHLRNVSCSPSCFGNNCLLG